MMVTFGLPELLIFLAILLIIVGPGCLAAPGGALKWWSRAAVGQTCRSAALTSSSPPSH